jgi:hypothetical protein
MAVKVEAWPRKSPESTLMHGSAGVGAINQPGGPFYLEKETGRLRLQGL